MLLLVFKYAGAAVVQLYISVQESISMLLLLFLGLFALHRSTSWLRSTSYLFAIYNGIEPR